MTALRENNLRAYRFNHGLDNFPYRRYVIRVSKRRPHWVARVRQKIRLNPREKRVDHRKIHVKVVLKFVFFEAPNFSQLTVFIGCGLMVGGPKFGSKSLGKVSIVL